MTPDLERLDALLGAAELAGLRQRLRARFRRAAPTDVFTLDALSAPERAALEGLLGRRTSAARSMRLSCRALDEALARAGLAADLRAALEALDGPLESHAERAQRAQAWTRLVDEAADPRLQRLLATPTGLGLLKRLADDPVAAAAMVRTASRALARLPAHGLPLAQLAAETAGDAHALDSGHGLAALVLRAAEADRLSPEEAAAERAAGSDEDTRVRNRWARAGVVVNELSAPALCLNLEAEEDSIGGHLLAAARAAGEPLHLSLGLLLRTPPRWRVAGRSVFVCENPTIVAIAAAQFGARCAPLVCTDGMPAAAQQALLGQLAAAGARLHYHGDFDWPGITIGNFVMRRFGARPWRFGAADYRGRTGKPLASTPVTASWDPELRETLCSGGYQLHEEAVAGILLQDLAAAP
ncbi:MAG: TIGR02679 family protein [Pseudomonadota bacterium]